MEDLTSSHFQDGPPSSVCCPPGVLGYGSHPAEPAQPESHPLEATKRKFGVKLCLLLMEGYQQKMVGTSLQSQEYWITRFQQKEKT